MGKRYGRDVNTGHVYEIKEAHHSSGGLTCAIITVILVILGVLLFFTALTNLITYGSFTTNTSGAQSAHIASEGQQYLVFDAKKTGNVVESATGVYLDKGASIKFDDVEVTNAGTYHLRVVTADQSGWGIYDTVNVNVNDGKTVKVGIKYHLSDPATDTIELNAGKNTISLSNESSGSPSDCNNKDHSGCTYIGVIVVSS